MTVSQLFKKRSVQIVCCILSPLLTAYYIHGFVNLVRQTHTRYIAQDFVAASEKLNQSPPGFKRVEVFIKQLKAINTNYAPAEVKKALHDYISAMEQGIDAIKAGQNTKPFDLAAANAKTRLIASVRKWDETIP